MAFRTYVTNLRYLRTGRSYWDAVFSRRNRRKSWGARAARIKLEALIVFELWAFEIGHSCLKWPENLAVLWKVDSSPRSGCRHVHLTAHWRPSDSPSACWQQADCKQKRIPLPRRLRRALAQTPTELSLEKWAFSKTLRPERVKQDILKILRCVFSPSGGRRHRKKLSEAVFQIQIFFN